MLSYGKEENTLWREFKYLLHSTVDSLFLWDANYTTKTFFWEQIFTLLSVFFLHTNECRFSESKQIWIFFYCCDWFYRSLKKCVQCGAVHTTWMKGRWMTLVTWQIEWMTTEVKASTISQYTKYRLKRTIVLVIVSRHKWLIKLLCKRCDLENYL